MKVLREKITSDKLYERIFYCTIVFLVIFISVVILSYYLLPAGLLVGKQSADFEITDNLLANTIRIFMWNLISVICIFIGSLFSKKTKKDNNYMSTGYTVFFVLIIINAITLGTWSFSVKREAVSLIDRIFGFFNITENAGLIEMIGQLLILCSLAKISIVRTCGKVTETSRLRNIKLAGKEKIAVLLGFLLIFVGALVEGIAIKSLI